MNLLITCDNGISALEPVKLAKNLGMKVIITDHHDVGFVEDEDGRKNYLLPEADAIINPKRQDCKYPFKNLSGAGVAFKFVQALYKEFNIDMDESSSVGFVAMKLCDVVELVMKTV